MAELKTFHVHHADEIPPVSADAFRKANQISDHYPAKTKNSWGEVRFSVVSYDFKKKRWCRPLAGVFTIVEYYSETTLNTLSHE